jgi:hypothetical protein
MEVCLGPSRHDVKRVLDKGDNFNSPTGLSRGFGSISREYGMIMARAGGGTAGGGEIWLRQVVEEARAHALVLGVNGLYSCGLPGASLPEGVGAMPVRTAAGPTWQG